MKNILVLLLILAIFLTTHFINAGKLVKQCSDSKQIALTFDDGPRPGITEYILEVLDEYEIKATFFIIGRNLFEKGSRETLKRIYSRGHSIGTHSWNHEYMGQMSMEEVRREIQNTSNEIYQITGFRPSIFRAPYGQINGYMYNYAEKVIGWSFDTGDWKLNINEATVDSIVASIKDYLENHPSGPILLMHDLCYANEVLRKIIPIINDMGYKFVTLE